MASTSNLTWLSQHEPNVRTSSPFGTEYRDLARDLGRTKQTHFCRNDQRAPGLPIANDHDGGGVPAPLGHHYVTRSNMSCARCKHSSAAWPGNCAPLEAFFVGTERARTEAGSWYHHTAHASLASLLLVQQVDSAFAFLSD